MVFAVLMWYHKLTVALSLVVDIQPAGQAVLDGAPRMRASCLAMAWVGELVSHEIVNRALEASGDHESSLHEAPCQNPGLIESASPAPVHVEYFPSIAGQRRLTYFAPIVVDVAVPNVDCVLMLGAVLGPCASQSLDERLQSDYR